TARVNSTVTVTETAAVTVNSAAAATIAPHGGGGQTAPAGSAVPIAPSVIVTDAFANPVSGVSVTFAPGPGSGSVTGAAQTTDASGIAAVGSWTLGPTAGQNTLTAASGSLSGSPVTFTANGTAGTATQLVFSVQPSTTPAGAAITPAVQVTALDAQGNTATGFTGNVTLAIGTNPGTGTLGGTLTHAAVGGVATFANLAIDKVGTGYTLTATGAGTATSAAFNITAGTATQLVFSVQPSTTPAGAAITPAVQVTAQDAQGNTATGFTGNVTVAIGTNPSTGTLGGTKIVAAVAGVATFANLSIDKVGTGYTLTATGAGSVTSAAFNITAGTATQLTITTPPSATAQSGVAFTPQPVLQLRDANGNVVSQAGTTVTAVIATGPTGATLTNAAATTTGSGAATFNGLAVSGS